MNAQNKKTKKIKGEDEGREEGKDPRSREGEEAHLYSSVDCRECAVVVQ